MADIETKIDNIGKDIKTIMVDVSALKVRANDNKEEIDRLRDNNNRHNAFNSVLAVIAGVFGSLYGIEK